MSAVTVGARRRVDGPIHLADYDPEWPVLYEREAARVRDLLGDRVHLLEHVGSTSVPGLPAKPIIDMLLVVADSATSPPTSRRWRPAATPCGSASPTGTSTGCSRARTPTSTCTPSATGRSEIERMLAFRDRLRTHDDERELLPGDEARAGRPPLGLRPGLRRRQGRGRRGHHRAGAGRSRRGPRALTSSAAIDTVRART